MTDDEQKTKQRQDFDYEPEVLSEPVGGPIPQP
jgi:hypothetical protein